MEKEKLLQAIQTARATAEDAGGPGLCLAGVLGVVEVSFQQDLCQDVLGVLGTYSKEKARENEADGMKAVMARAVEIAEKLNKLEPWPLSYATKNLIPCDKGLYIFRQNGKVVYVGVGTGKKGLRGRIWSQHLAKGYKKSVLRRKVAKTREDSLRYINENFTLAFFPTHMDDLVTMKMAELILIARHRPIYNNEAEVK